MKGSGKLSGAVMQIAFILTALHFQSLISAPAMTSLCFSPPPLFYPSPHLPHPFPFFLSFMFFFFSPISPRAFIRISFHLLLPVAPPLIFPLHLSTSISEEFLLHLFACGRKKRRRRREKQEHFGGECESLPLNRHNRGSRLESVTGVGSAFEVLDVF